MLRVVETEYGKVRGIEAADPRITAFKGIPFAAPPVGENRWRAPQKAESWTGVRDCFRFGPIPMQDQPGVGDDLYCKEWHVDPDIEMSEDCLYLNVWTPARSADEKLPVVIWFFGGALQWGYTAEMEFDGERVARRGVVVVSVGYRLAALGFMTHPDLIRQQPEAPANFGLLDQQEGMRWVQRNIAAFGGDPGNVTIAGQSAGGGSVMSQLACTANKGLFNKAIIQSGIVRFIEGPSLFDPTPLDVAAAKGEELFALMGVKTLEEARKLDAYYIRSKYAEYCGNDFTPAGMQKRFLNVRDDKYSFGDPYEIIASGKGNNVPIMSGNTSDEFIMPAKDPKYEGLCPVEYGVKKLALLREANGIKDPLYYYRFDIDMPGGDNAGNFHSSELWFFFETLAKCWRPFTGKYYDLSRQMCNYWCNFIKTGDPNGKDIDGTQMAKWLPYKKGQAYDMIFKTDGPVTADKSCEDGVLKELVEG
ncbi:MAG: carboxylesterase family protein [Lachnospiraceae bacterium]|nr:carboxylesterase family protein [Lachnospiraceae bacterium]